MPVCVGGGGLAGKGVELEVGLRGGVCGEDRRTRRGREAMAWCGAWRTRRMPRRAGHATAVAGGVTQGHHRQHHARGGVERRKISVAMLVRNDWLSRHMIVTLVVHVLRTTGRCSRLGGHSTHQRAALGGFGAVTYFSSVQCLVNEE